MVRTADIVAAAFDGRGSVPVGQLLDTITDADHGGLPHVHGDHPLGLALSRMGSTRHTVLPVVSRANVRMMLGVVTLPDILRVYGVERVDDVPDLASRVDD
jgi:CBS domain-containing protein